MRACTKYSPFASLAQNWSVSSWASTRPPPRRQPDCRISSWSCPRSSPAQKHSGLRCVWGVIKEFKLLSSVNAFHAPEHLLHAVNCTYMSNPRLCKRSQILNVAFDQAFYCNLQLVVRFKSIYLPVARMMLSFMNIVSVELQSVKNAQAQKLLPTGRALCLMVGARKLWVRYKIYPRCCVHRAEHLFLLLTP